MYGDGALYAVFMNVTDQKSQPKISQGQQIQPPTKPRPSIISFSRICTE